MLLLLIFLYRFLDGSMSSTEELFNVSSYLHNLTFVSCDSYRVLVRAYAATRIVDLLLTPLNIVTSGYTHSLWGLAAMELFP
jgi:hypothetical protein